jgi:hypothetical protein
MPLTWETMLAAYALMTGISVVVGLAILTVLLPFGDARFRVWWVWRPWVRRRLDARQGRDPYERP